MEFTVITHIKGITECVKLAKNVGKYLCSPYYRDKENLKCPGSDSVTKCAGVRQRVTSFQCLSPLLLDNVAESIIVLNCSVGTKWIPTS